MILHDLSAIGAAACWALGGLLGAAPSRYFGPFAFTRYRLTAMTLLLGAASLLNGGWHTLTSPTLLPVVLSGLTGIFLGDTFMFAAMNRLGPRRTGLIFATHSVFSVGLGMALLGERPGLAALFGSLMVFGGVLLAVAGGRRDNAEPDLSPRSLIAGSALLGLVAAICQALGTFFAKPAIATGLDPLTASALRMGTGALAHWLLFASGVPLARPNNPITSRMLGQTLLNGLVALGLGMTLIMVALQGGDVGTVGMLSALSPVLLLPMLWLHHGKRPVARAWAGALVSVAGSMLILGTF